MKCCNRSTGCHERGKPTNKHVAKEWKCQGSPLDGLWYSPLAAKAPPTHPFVAGSVPPIRKNPSGPQGWEKSVNASEWEKIIILWFRLNCAMNVSICWMWIFCEVKCMKSKPG